GVTREERRVRRTDDVRIGIRLGDVSDDRSLVHRFTTYRAYARRWIRPPIRSHSIFPDASRRNSPCALRVGPSSTSTRSTPQNAAHAGGIGGGFRSYSLESETLVLLCIINTPASSLTLIRLP